ncbi:MAG: low temperature requirement protein A [Lachnospiraceae bacterium]|nr:low temperature requirement protein A [Lachnospiraceae bacterium]
MNSIAKDEKKVEYLELIYDLVFVYIIGRNNQILHNVNGGFITLGTFGSYVVATLAVIQIWNFSTFYINMFGKNGIRDHVALFINMYLLYYIGKGTRIDWAGYQNEYHIAWALILINIGIQYLIEMGNHKDSPDVLKTIYHMMAALFGEAVIILIAIPVFNIFGVQIALAAIIYGVAVTWYFADNTKAEMVDFTHLSERAMLYVVFTFGEMIIVISEYFNGGFNANNVYFSLMSFLIVVALFLSYGFLYDHVIDRERKSTGMVYMFIHIFLIFAMNNITAALEFMRDPSVELNPKVLFLIGSFLLYFACLFCLLIFAKEGMRMCRNLLFKVLAGSAVFVVLMLSFKADMYVNIALSVVYVFSIFIALYAFGRQRGRLYQKEG